VKVEGWGLTKAPPGGHGYVVNGQNYRVDKLCHPEGFINDILGSGGTGAFTPQWGPNPDPNGNPSNWAPAIGNVTPPPAQPPPSASLDAAVRVLIEAAVAPLRTDIAALKTQKPPAPQPLSLTGRKVALRTDNGYYVVAEDGGAGEVNATRQSVGGWETFTLEEQ
jgi:hypothetical protein